MVLLALHHPQLNTQQRRKRPVRHVGISSHNGMLVVPELNKRSKKATKVDANEERKGALRACAEEMPVWI